MYVNATGLMWEHAEAFGALLVFAEHRYYGASQPFGPDSFKMEPRYLSTEQAIEDYASLIYDLKAALGATGCAQPPRRCRSPGRLAPPPALRGACASARRTALGRAARLQSRA